MPGTGVTPSAAKTWALITAGVVSHIPPLAPSGSRSRIVAFQASLLPLFRMSRVKFPRSPRFMVAGPVLVSTSSGPAMVMGGVMPDSPGSGS